MDPESLTTGWGVTVGAIVAIAILLAGSFPKILGPIEGYLRERAARGREARIASDDADIQDLRRQVLYLSERLRQTDERERRWQREWEQHRAWDYAAMQALLDGRDPPFPIPPPLMTPDPISKEETP